MDNQDNKLSESAERIVDIAADLFSDYGYHGVSTRQIAKAAGLNVSTVSHHVGSKRDLYMKVIKKMYDEETLLISNFEAKLENEAKKKKPDFKRVLNEIADTFIHVFDTQPYRARLYMLRWMEPSDDLMDEEEALSNSQYKTMYDMLYRAQNAGIIDSKIDLKMLLRSIDWIVFGYFVSGPMDMKNSRCDPHDKKNLKEFRNFLYEYFVKMLGFE
ncbi:MAG TPA: TetR/AcrR family transcriptional regulator [bacterium]|nr:TetR/AcrR family transcriptional regulator [bacterium]